MLAIGIWLAVAVLAVTGTAWGTPKALAGINHRRHDACLARIAVLELDLGLRETPRRGGYMNLAEVLPPPSSASPWRSLPPAACGDMAAQIEANRKEALRVAAYTSGQQRAAEDEHPFFRRSPTRRKPSGR